MVAIYAIFKANGRHRPRISNDLGQGYGKVYRSNEFKLHGLRSQRGKGQPWPLQSRRIRKRYMHANESLRRPVIGFLIGQLIFNILASTNSPVFISNSLTDNLILRF